VPRVFLIVVGALLSVGCATALRLAPVTPGSAADPDSPEPPRPPLSQTLRPDATKPRLVQAPFRNRRLEAR